MPLRQKFCPGIRPEIVIDRRVTTTVDLTTQSTNRHRQGGIDHARSIARVQEKHLVRRPIWRGERHIAGGGPYQPLARVKNGTGGVHKVMVGQDLARSLQQRRDFHLALLRFSQSMTQRLLGALAVGDVDGGDDDLPIRKRSRRGADAGPDQLAIFFYDADLDIVDGALFPDCTDAGEILGGKRGALGCEIPALLKAALLQRLRGEVENPRQGRVELHHVSISIQDRNADGQYLKQPGELLLAFAERPFGLRLRGDVVPGGDCA